jgi:hypothetical protein
MTNLLLACQKCSGRSPELTWKHCPYRDGRRQIEVFYAVLNTPDVPAWYDEDKRCNWVANSRGVTGHTCLEFGKVWRAQGNLGTNFITHEDGGLMYTERPAPSLQSRLAANQPPPSVIPEVVHIPPNSQMGTPLGLRMELKAEDDDYREKIRAEAIRHSTANAEIERDHRQKDRGIRAHWGRR